MLIGSKENLAQSIRMKSFKADVRSPSLAANGSLGLTDKISDPFPQPVIASSIPIDFIHPLLNNRPGAITGKEDSTTHSGGNAAGMPVITQDTAKSLKPDIIQQRCPDDLV